MGAWAMLVDGRLTYPPPVDGTLVNPCLDPGWRERHLFTWWEDSAIAEQLAAEAAATVPAPEQEEPAPDYTTVDVLCGEFRNLCNDIGSTTGTAEFRGGFEEVIALMKGAYGSDPYVVNLCNKLGWLNQYITYEANKCRLGQPGWWKRCWGIE